MKLKLILILVTTLLPLRIEKNEINRDFGYLDNIVNVQKEIFIEKREEYVKNNYFKGEHKKIIIKKINRYLNSTLDNKGEFIVNYSLKVGMDPYLATAVMLQETGCYWNCSYLVRHCNNVGGNKGSPGCNGGSYREFNDIETGIKFAINKLNSYYKKGKTTAKEINPSYATDKTWYKKVNNYIKKLKRPL